MSKVYEDDRDARKYSDIDQGPSYNNRNGADDVQMKNGDNNGAGDRSPPRRDDRDDDYNRRDEERTAGKERDSYRDNREPRGSAPPRRPPNAPPAEPSNVLGVFGLSIRTNERDIEHEFSRSGRVEKVTVVYDQRSGRSRGFGFVVMETIQDAERAIADLNGIDLQGRRIRVDFSATTRPHEPTPGQYKGFRRDDYHSRDRYGGGGYGGGGRPYDRYGGGGDRYGGRDDRYHGGGRSGGYDRYDNRGSSRYDGRDRDSGGGRSYNDSRSSYRERSRSPGRSRRSPSPRARSPARRDDGPSDLPPRRDDY